MHRTVARINLPLPYVSTQSVAFVHCKWSRAEAIVILMVRGGRRLRVCVCGGGGGGGWRRR